jgi:lipopolysaccharide transport system permease protein
MIDWNPLASVVENSRRCVLSGEPLEWEGWVFSMIVGAAAAILGYAFFMKSKKGFADVL